MNRRLRRRQEPTPGPNCLTQRGKIPTPPCSSGHRSSARSASPRSLAQSLLARGALCHATGLDDICHLVWRAQLPARLLISSTTCCAPRPAMVANRRSGSTREPWPISTRASMRSLAELGIYVRINELQRDTSDAIRFSEDRVHASYDRDLRPALLAHSASVGAGALDRFLHTSFIGKCTFVDFFGSFDLAVMRFSARRAPKFSGAGGVPNDARSGGARRRPARGQQRGVLAGGQGFDHPLSIQHASPARAASPLNGTSGESCVELGSQPVHPALRRCAHRPGSGSRP